MSRRTISEDFLRVAIITVIGVFIVLVLLLRALIAPIYLVLTVLLSFGASMGLSTMIFQDYLGHAGVNYFVPLLVFVLLVALGSDYNIFLMSRVREESDKRGVKDGIRFASARTGTVITSAGIILAGTFAALMTAPRPDPVPGRRRGRARRPHRHVHRAEPARAGDHRAGGRFRLVAGRATAACDRAAPVAWPNPGAGNPRRLADSGRGPLCHHRRRGEP